MTQDPSDGSFWRNLILGGQGQGPSDYQQTYKDRPQIQDLINQGFGRTNGAAPTLAMGPQDQFRAQQMAQAQQLQRIASGQQQGAGELAAQRQTQNAIAAQQGMARMARGGNSALAFRNAASNAANAGLAGAGQAQQAALQDQQMAQGQLSNVLNQGRGTDVSIAGQNASNQLQQSGLNNQMYMNMLSQLTGMNQAELAAQMQAYQTGSQDHGILGGLLSSAGQIGASAASGGGAGAAGAAAMSDERVKKDIEDAGDEIDDMLDHLHAKSYRYKDEARHGAGRRAGVIAQDLLRSKAGRQVVFDHPDGHALDVNKAVSAALAASARLNERVRDLERRKEK